MVTPTVRSRVVGRGLRARITFAFTLGGLLLALTFAAVAYAFAYNVVVNERAATARRQTYTNARIVRDALARPGMQVGEALALLDLPANSPVVLRQGDDWFGSSAGFGQKTVPDDLQAVVRQGQAGLQRAAVLGETRQVVGVPIVSANVEFYELYSLNEVESTLAALRWALFAGAVVVCVAAALLGLWASRRVLRPVSEVSNAAARIAKGDLSARLEDPDDPDLSLLTTSFNTMVDALRARIDRDARFVSDVSHELKSPLTTLATCAQVLDSRRDALSERDRAALDLLTAEIGRFQELVRDLLELSRADAEVDALRLEPVRLGELVLNLTARFERPEFVVEITPPVAQSALLLDKQRLERVLQNVFDNARVHAEGVVTVSVSRHAAQEFGAELWVTVDDEGPGVPDDERVAVFERFYRGAASGRRGSVGGSGIGLALVAEHVRAHDGRVWIEDGPNGHGTRVVIALPWRPV